MANVTIPQVGNAGASTITGAESLAADSLVKTDTNKDTAAIRRCTFPASGGGSDSQGFMRGGARSYSSSQTIDLADINGMLFGFTTGSSALTATLLDAADAPGQIFAIFKVDSGTGTLTITRANANTIDGNTTLVLRRQYEGYLIQVLTSTTFKILSYFDGTLGTLRTPIVDPGSAGAIPVTSSGYCAITSVGSDTRTLAIPSFVGQQLLLIHAVDGGSVAVTAASAINIAGNTVMTATAVRAWILLTASLTGSTKVWTVTATDGFTLS
jgi:hypothetical protein